jgi:hypothetical protein
MLGKRCTARDYRFRMQSKPAALAAEQPRSHIVRENHDTVIDFGLCARPREPEASMRGARQDVCCPSHSNHNRWFLADDPLVVLRNVSIGAAGIAQPTACTTGMLSPPLIVTETQVGEIFDKVARIIKAVA